MKKYIHLAIFAISSALMCSCQSESTSTQNNEDGWLSLFGENLSDAVYAKDVWSLKDGVLTPSRDDIIFTKRDWANFELELEFKITKGSNSGVVVYCSDIQKWIPNSIEIQIADNADKRNSQPTRRNASIFGHVDPEFDTTVPFDEWQKMRIVCKGAKIDVWLNGKHASSMDMLMWTNKEFGPDGTRIPKWLTLHRKSDMPTTGRIGLQGVHGKAATYFKNVKVRPLK